jgi:glutamine amidotransferase
MCRVLSYLGDPILVEELLYKPDNSFITQSYHPKYMSHLLNLAGFGMVAWDRQSHNTHLPFYYKTERLPFYDDNLRNLSKKISPYCILAHLRGVSYNSKNIVSNQNVHPFMFEGANIALAHNGELFDFHLMKYDLLEYILPDYQDKIKGTTDSEWIYALFLSQLPVLTEHYETSAIINAITQTLKIIQRARNKHNLAKNSPVNVFISNGDFIAATRFVYDYGWTPLGDEPSTHSAYHSLWYTFGEGYGYHNDEYRMKEGGKKSSIIIASEPLTEDVTTWIEVPEYTMIIARRENNEIKIVSQDITL